ncbi:MAG: hypothetical protein ACTJGT_01725 [Microbacteriaceae bacterium]
MTEQPAPAKDPLQERARAYVEVIGSEDEQQVDYALAEARALVQNRIGKADVPQSIKDRAVLEVMADLFHRRMARNGVMEIGSTDLAPFRIARDPMRAAYDILAPFLPAGIA